MPISASCGLSSTVRIYWIRVDFPRFGRYCLDSHRKPMSPKRRLRIVSLTLLISRPLYPCSIVIIGGYSPTTVRQLSGTVVGSGRFDLMGHTHDKERSSVTVAGATISVRTRTDTAIFKKGEVKYPQGIKHLSGNLKEWKCGNEVSGATADQAGNFAIIGLQPGKCCLDITGPPQNDEECGSYSVESGTKVCIPLHESFIINVILSAPKTKLIADISLRYPDCSGGSSLKLTPQD
jgi:hypothetical protein